MRASRSTLGCALLLLATLLPAGCGGGTEPRVPTTVALSAATISFTAVGQTQQLTATVADQDGASIPSPTITWASTNTAAATVSASGLVSAAGGGSATIAATAGSATASAVVTVVQTPAEVQKAGGDNQTTTVGQPVPLLLSVRVVDANNVTIPGATVTFVADASSGTVGTPSTATGADGVASTTFTVLATGAVQVTAAVSGTALSATFTENGVSAFTVDLQFLTPPSAAQLQAFQAARQRWQNLIAGDLGDVVVSAAAGDCGAESPSIVNRPVDDVLILVSLTPIDGPGSVLGAAGPCLIRATDQLTALGLMRFDTDDLDLIESAGLLEAVILHEMGHVFGYGTLWPTLGLLADPSQLGGTDPHFTGAQATLEFDAAGGAGYVGGLKIPVENTGGAGAADAHWRESVLGSELMTGFVDQGVNPLSRISVASLADLGYTVNLAGADPYTLAPGLRAFSRGRRLDLRNDLLRMPLRVVDGAGQVVREVAP